MFETGKRLLPKHSRKPPILCLSRGDAINQVSRITSKSGRPLLLKRMAKLSLQNIFEICPKNTYTLPVLVDVFKSIVLI